MSRRCFVIAATLATVPAGGLVAEPAPWAPLRLGGSVVIAAPLAGHLLLSSFEVHVLQQAGWVNVDGDGHGSGLIAGIGGTGGLGLFEGKGDACADEVDGEGNTRWTCGQLTLGPTAMIGFASGTKLETGFVRQDRLVYLRATPHLALVKNPERGAFEVGLATALGFSFRPYQLEATWIKIPGDSYVGVSIGLSASVSGWLVNDRPVATAIAADAAEAEAEAQEPPTHWRIDLLGQALAPVLAADGEPTAGAADVAVIKLSGFPDSPSKAWHRWSGLGGELRALGTGQGNGDSAVQIGPVAMAGVARFDGQHPLFSLYGRVAPMIGVRDREHDTSFEYGGFVAVGTTLGFPEHLDDDGETTNDTGALGLGLEVTAGWMRGAVFVGAGIGLVMW